MSELDYTHNVEDYERSVFVEACKNGYFTTYQQLKLRSQRRTEFADFPSAAMSAYAQPQTAVYAVTEAGRSVMVARDRWETYLALWRELRENK